MDRNSYSLGALLKMPSGFLPLAMSGAGLVLVLAHIVLYGAVRQADEGAAAHIWQLLMIGQLPFFAFFAMRFLSRAPRQASSVLRSSFSRRFLRRCLCLSSIYDPELTRSKEKELTRSKKFRPGPLL